MIFIPKGCQRARVLPLVSKLQPQRSPGPRYVGGPSRPVNLPTEMYAILIHLVAVRYSSAPFRPNNGGTHQLGEAVQLTRD